MAQKIELMPGVEIDLNDGLERGDLIDGKTQEEAAEESEKEQENIEAAEKILEKDEKPTGDQKVEEKPEEKVETKPDAEEESLKIFKIKYAGEERELKLTDQELIDRLQMSEDYQVKMEKLGEQRREIEPFKHILETDWFKEKLKEGLESGEISQPKAPEPPSEDVLFEYERRKMDTDFDTVREAMRRWAVTLPITMQTQLDSNYAVFIKEYDRIADILRKPKTTPPLNLTKTEEKKVDKIIEKKEQMKTQARVEKPGSSSEISANKAKQARIRDLKKQMRSGIRADEAAAELLLLTTFSTE